MRKNFKAILLVNWKSGAMRIVKRRTNRKTPWEVGIRVDLDIETPEDKDAVFKGKITIPETQVKDMIFESL